MPSALSLWLLTGDVAKALDLSAENVRRLHRIGRLRAAMTANGTRIFERAEVERLKAERAASQQRQSPRTCK
jgi:DNA-binding transcriptional MerR regulator